jgi:hypothetical protein
MADPAGASALGGPSLLSGLSIFDDLQEGDHHEECLSFLNEHGSVIKAIGAVILEFTIYASKSDRALELHHSHSENRRPNICRSTVTGQSSTIPPTKEFILQTKSVLGKVAASCTGESQNNWHYRRF